ncbi:DNA-binding response regulator [Bosea caraganae]|uniref:DNA-binding response regulator n=1 Tax=Bosea caraganae TaxID=2763117 RepID=A0A370LBA8_9HYPH|nr:response regulator [Bosea caraganae]RDJ27246.1 DNA-binding response regulator [Bosea caraganae]RDJ29262.1 DNA-binding response regulator [Bosea caraganae]
MPIIVHLVDDDPSFRTAIGRLLHASGYEVRAYSSAQELLDHLPEGEEASCIVLDVQIPGISGPELQDRLIRLGLVLPIIFLTGHGDIPTSVQVIKAGAEDFLTKPVSREALLAAIERGIARQGVALEQRCKLKEWRSRLDKLTRREREVFEQVVRGKMNKQIAYQLGTTERTIKAHRQKVMEKIDARSVAELVSIAERLGALSPVQETMQAIASEVPPKVVNSAKLSN